MERGSGAIQQDKQQYEVGVMRTVLGNREAPDFQRQVDTAVERFKDALSESLLLNVRVFQFAGPQLVPLAGGYSALDFLELAISEKLERDIDFLLVVTDVDLHAATRSYTLALPSQITGTGIVSMRRLAPDFWGEPADEEVAVRRLAGLMLHTFGHLLSLNHNEDPGNAMYDFVEVEDLDAMDGYSPQQEEKMRRLIPKRAHTAVSSGNPWSFAIRQVYRNIPEIAETVVRANPFELITRLPTMITTSLSVMVLLFFTPEVWDVGLAVDVYQLAIFGLIGLVGAVFVLYQSFSLNTTLDRKNILSETTVLTVSATMLSLTVTMLVLFLIFVAVVYLATVTIFPQRLLSDWPVVGAISQQTDVLKVAMFLAAVGLLAGSLGGRADSKPVIRRVLFLDEET